jgi:tRNA threonylcarbamoyladenosine modification (KEOPS) complex Cgi121 subunit
MNQPSEKEAAQNELLLKLAAMYQVKEAISLSRERQAAHLSLS